jgi:hypothetical protein
MMVVETMIEDASVNISFYWGVDIEIMEYNKWAVTV